jgi:hypothetical protein
LTAKKYLINHQFQVKTNIPNLPKARAQKSVTNRTSIAADCQPSALRIEKEKKEKLVNLL